MLTRTKAQKLLRKHEVRARKLAAQHVAKWGPVIQYQLNFPLGILHVLANPGPFREWTVDRLVKALAMSRKQLNLVRTGDCFACPGSGLPARTNEGCDRCLAKDIVDHDYWTRRRVHIGPYKVAKWHVPVYICK